MNPTAGPSNAQRYDSFAPPPRNPTLPMTTPSPHASAPAALPRLRVFHFPLKRYELLTSII
jgi:hypothetical protein